MDPSALIFVALAVAWAVYLIPKALEHHEESARTRTVEGFSARMRVLARREPVSRRRARLVREGASSGATAIATGPTTSRAVKRRRRVLALLVLATVAVAAFAYLQRLDWIWCAVPGGLLVAWLVTCRVMVRRERRAAARRRRAAVRRDAAGEPAAGPVGTVATTSSRPAAASAAAEEQEREPGRWDPVPVTLPTYVSKPAAPRSVTTIDLDSTGVWSSGPNAADSALAAEAAEIADRAAAAQGRRATGT